MLFKYFLKKLFYKEYSLVPTLHSNFWSKIFVFNIVLVVVLALLSIWGANFLERVMDPLKYTKDINLIVEIYPEVNYEKTNSKISLVKDYLKQNHNIASFKFISQEELKNLLTDWTNFLNNLSVFSFPTLINVVLDSKTKYSASDLQLALSQRVNNVFVYSEKQLASKLTSSIKISRNLILLIPLLLFFTIFIIILFATISLVYTQRESISVLSFLGAPYSKVAKEFSFWVLKKTVKGCIFGFIVSFILVETFVLLLNVGWFVFPSITTLWFMLIVVVTIPLESTIVTFFWVRKVITWVI